MSEKMPNEEDSVDLSRRNFLKGLGAVGAVTAIGGVAHLVDESEETTQKVSQEIAPYDVPVDSLSRQEVMDEIVHDVGRIVRLQTLVRYGGSSTPTDQENFNIAYFLESYHASGTTPTNKEVEGEIARLEQRVAVLRARRDADK